MKAELLWAGVRFRAENGDTDGLLTEAAKRGLHLSAVLPCPGGFTADCAAWHYRNLAILARRKRARLRIQKRKGLFFRLRPLFRRTGIFLGVLIFVPLLLWLQGCVWSIQFNDLTTGQQARAARPLREKVGLIPGSRISESLLTAGEYALLESGEFSWASLNFLDGRLVVEAAAATPVPEIASGTMQGIRARTAGTIVDTNLVSGTMLVSPGQTVETGQELIGTSRSERDGTLIFQPAAGSVRARFDWESAQEIPLLQAGKQYTGGHRTSLVICFGSRHWTVPSFSAIPTGDSESGSSLLRHVQPEIFGLPLPLLLEETTCYLQRAQEFRYSEEEALALARLASLQALHADFPDAEILARKEDSSVLDNTLRYTAVYTILADICDTGETHSP